jgi:hypothetical protein
MRSARFGLLLSILLLNIPVWGQQSQTPVLQPQPTIPPQTQPVTTLPPAPQDPQAVIVLNQALTVAGGTAAIKAVTDYTATGNITYNWNPEQQGTVTVLGLGTDQIRLDANLARGIHSSVISNGQSSTKTEDGRVTQYPPPYPVPSSDAYPYQPPMFPSSLLVPHMQLAVVLNSPRYSISYKGVVQLDGNSVHDILVQRIMPGQTQPDSMTEYHTMEYFIDTATLQIAMTQDNVPKHIVHQIRYSGYRAVNGVLVPFSIGERMGGQRTREIQLSQISFNTGLQDSGFAIQ